MNKAALAQAMQQAMAWYGARDWEKSEQVCRLVLAQQAGNPDALGLLGIITAQTGRLDEAADLLGKVAQLRRNDPAAHNNFGNVLRDLSRYEEALLSYERALRLKPAYAEACYNRGLTLYHLKRYEEAIASYDRAIRLKPDHAAAFNNRGVALRELGRLDEAIDSYDRALALAPNHASAHNNRGVALQESKRLPEAIDSYSRAIAINPDYAEALNNQGNALRELGRLDEALESLERALAVNPRYADAYTSRGRVLHQLNRWDDALRSFDSAIALDPRNADAYCNRGVTLKAMSLNDLALQSFQQALEIRPDSVADLYLRGSILHELKQFDAALDCYRRAFEIDPDHHWLAGILLHERLRICDWEGLDERLELVTSQIERGIPASPPFVVITSTDCADLHRRAAEIWARETVLPGVDGPPPVWKRTARPKIRIGYYSADYHMHATALLAAGLFERHDRSRFEVIAFNFGLDQPDAMTERLRSAFDRFLDVRSHTDLQIAQLSREMEIDIAVDLKGYTLHQRPAIFAHRPAPIQAGYLGYPGTLGAPLLDYLIADRTLIPPDSRAHYAEKIVELPGSYQVNDRTRIISERVFSRDELGLPQEGFVFCSFNSSYKILPRMFECWMRILGRVEGSVLWLLEGNTTAAANLRQAALRCGIDPARLIFTGYMRPAEHLARQRVAQLFLDSWPCNAHTTASDALWAGLPVLTLAGESFPARVAASLLNAVGLPELVATGLDRYEELAVGLASDPERLSGLARRLNDNRMTAPLFDTPLFTKRIEAAYQEMVGRYRQGLPPDHITITES